MFYSVVAMALMPAVILVWYIYKRDKYQPEPSVQLWKGAGWGVAAALACIIPELVITAIAEKGGLNMESQAGAVFKAFFVAAIPEEAVKLLFLYLFLRKNPYYDEYMDGIVYAVCVGMGFAGFENLLYLFGNIDNWVSVGVVRALFSVPGHFAFAVLMGYFYAQWSMRGRSTAAVLMITVPVVFHGIFDMLLMLLPVSEPVVVAMLFLGFMAFVVLMHINCHKLIARQLEQDAACMTLTEEMR